ncbi:MAG TPA: hypothetical protein VMT70_06815 [Vicinamibacteria bacterium]|nr:hypothetical protein [Vicinamibacteria bacterium]
MTRAGDFDDPATWIDRRLSLGELQPLLFRPETEVTMSTVTALDDEYATLWYHPDGKIVHHEIHKFLVPGALEKLLSAGASLMETHGAQKWLSDDRKNVVISKQDLEWAEVHWIPRVQKAGFRYWAIVVPGHAVAALQMRALQAKRRTQGIEVATFETVEEGMAWLRSR